jgi:tetratricopeptide (TPR) repeat protein
MAERLSPNDPLRFAFCTVRGLAHYLLQDFQLALQAAEEAVRLPHAHAHIQAFRIVALVKNGRLEAAKEAARTMLQERPDYSLRLYSQILGFRRKEDLQLCVDALAMAGVPK